MLLQRLCEYADRLDATPVMYLTSPVRWLIDLDSAGHLVGFVKTDGAGKKKDRGKEFCVPHVGRSSGVRAKLLADNGEYVLGVAREKSKPERVAECHEAFVAEVRKCAAATGEPIVQVVLDFLERLDLSSLKLPDDFDPADVCTFRIAGRLPVDSLAVQNYWASASGGDDADKPADVMQCLICGHHKPPLRRLPFKIKRIPGGQTSGTALISANSPAFESYGLEASLIAPTCADCGERFSKAANALIDADDTHITIGPLVYLFWTKQERPFSVASLLSNPEPAEVRTLIESAFSGRRAAAQVDETPFYATAFSASGARVAVRDWLDTTIASTRQNLARYFALQQLVDRDGCAGPPLGIYALAVATVRDTRDLMPNVPKALLHLALKGGPLPKAILYQAVKRNRAEQLITRPRAVLIKMVFLSHQLTLSQEDTMVQLETDNRDPAYLCGRLLAVLESVQQRAVPNANATITDRFFGTASSAPASVFGNLVRKSQAHLAKLRKERPGTEHALQAKLEAVLADLKTFPKTLTLEQQGLFGLGYYHQRAQDRADAVARRQEKEEHEAADAGH